MKRDIEFNGQFYTVTLLRGGGTSKVRIDDSEHRAALQSDAEGEYRLTLDAKDHDLQMVTQGEKVYLHAFGRNWELNLLDPIERAAGRGGADANVAMAPMPGVVIAVLVSPGDPVHEGQTLMIIESMKLETAIDAWRDGTVTAVHLNPGDTFDRGVSLVSLAEQED